MYKEFNGASSSIDARFAVIYFLMTCNERAFSQYMQAMEAVKMQSSYYHRYSLVGRGWIDLRTDDWELADVLPAYMLADGQAPQGLL